LKTGHRTKNALLGVRVFIAAKATVQILLAELLNLKAKTLVKRPKKFLQFNKNLKKANTTKSVSTMKQKLRP